MVEVTREQFAQAMLEYFKIVNQGYPELMEAALRKDWQGEFEDIAKAGLVIVTKEHDLVCVFYEAAKCPVRKQLRIDEGFEKYVKPMKGTDEEQVLMKIREATKGMFSSESMVLASFCHMCPIKFWQDQEFAVGEQQRLAKKLDQVVEVAKVLVAAGKCDKSPTGYHQQDPSGRNPGFCGYCGLPLVTPPSTPNPGDSET